MCEKNYQCPCCMCVLLFQSSSVRLFRFLIMFFIFICRKHGFELVKVCTWIYSLRHGKSIFSWITIEVLYPENLFQLNLNACLEDQGPFTVIIHKLTDIIASAVRNDIKVSRWSCVLSIGRGGLSDKCSNREISDYRRNDANDVETTCLLFDIFEAISLRIIQYAPISWPSPLSRKCICFFAYYLTFVLSIMARNSCLKEAVNNRLSSHWKRPRDVVT